jgi:hypothetical protein
VLVLVLVLVLVCYRCVAAAVLPLCCC